MHAKNGNVPVILNDQSSYLCLKYWQVEVGKVSIPLPFLKQECLSLLSAVNAIPPRTILIVVLPIAPFQCLQSRQHFWVRENCIFAISLTSLLYFIPERIVLFSACNAIRTRTCHTFYQSEFVRTVLAFAHMFWDLHFSHTAHPSERIHLVSYFCDYMIPYFKSKAVAFMATFYEPIRAWSNWKSASFIS